MSLSVCKMDSSNNNSLVALYEFITNPEEALLLAQLAMCDKKDCEIIVISPGWNMGLDKGHTDAYETALMLDRKYRVEKKGM